MKNNSIIRNNIRLILKTILIIFIPALIICSLSSLNNKSTVLTTIIISLAIITFISLVGFIYITIKNKNEISKLNDEERTFTELEISKKNDKHQMISSRTIAYIFLTIVAILSFLPFYWMIISSVKTEMEYRRDIATWFPETIQLKNYSAVLRQTNSNGGTFVQILINTLVVALVSTSIGLIITIITAYAFAKMDFKGKNIVFTILLGTMMIPGEMFTITNYITVAQLEWNNTYTVLIVPFMVSIYYIYLLRNNFMQIPNSLYQAAKVDGLSDMGYLIKVMIPLTAPTLISIALLKFIGTWNTYIWPRLVNDEGSWQLLSNWVSGYFTDKGRVLYPENSFSELFTLKMAAVCMVSLPLFLLFIFFRKYIMTGVSKSGTKG